MSYLFGLELKRAGFSVAIEKENFCCRCCKILRIDRGNNQCRRRDGITPTRTALVKSKMNDYIKYEQNRQSCKIKAKDFTALPRQWQTNILSFDFGKLQTALWCVCNMSSVSKFKPISTLYCVSRLSRSRAKLLVLLQRNSTLSKRESTKTY